MRVLYVVETLEIGGAERVVTDLVSHMPEGVESFVCCLKQSGPMAERLPEGVKVFELMAPEGNSVKVPLQLARIIRSQGIDIIHSHNWSTFVESGLAAKIVNNKPIISTIHGMYTEYDDTIVAAIKKNIRRLVERFLARKFVKICTVSSKIAEYTVPHLDVPSEKVCTIINGIQTEKKKKQSRALRKELGVELNDVVLCFVGRVAKVKNLKYLLSVMPEIIKSTAGVKLLIIGDGDEREALERYSKQIGLTENVLFCGFQENPMDFLTIADIFVLTSLYEGVSIALLESMAAGIPSIVTDVGGNKDVVKDSVTGFVVSLNSKKELIDRLKRLINDSELRKSFARASKKRVNDYFNIKNTVEKYHDIYVQCVD